MGPQPRHGIHWKLPRPRVVPETVQPPAFGKEFMRHLFRSIRFLLLLSAWTAIAGFTGVSCSRDKSVMRIAITTSMERMGIADILAETFTRETGIHVQFLVLPSGQALESLVRGDVDAAFAHAPEMEKKFRNAHPQMKPALHMLSGFVIAGPISDPAGVRGAASPADAFARIARFGAPFVSRGDASGTAEFERKTWQAAGVRPSSGNLLEIGRGASETLMLAAEKNAYTLAPLSLTITMAIL